jgi:PPM family protein phosphatase
MINSESIYYLFEQGHKIKQEDYIWPIPGKATANDRVFIVCDGTGSHESGEIASKLICQFMAANVMKFREKIMSLELIDRLLVEAQDELIAYARKHRLDTDLATAFSMLILYDQRALISWYGDSPIFHLRGGEILFRTKDNLPIIEPKQHTDIVRGIKADGSPIHAETKWIEDVQAGDYFLMCSKGLIEKVTDDDIKLLINHNYKENIDLAGSIKQLAFERTPGNYSMYLIRVNVAEQIEIKKGGITAIGKQNIDIRKQTIAIREKMIAIREKIIAIREKTNGNMTPIAILAMTIIGMFILFIYFRSVRTSAPIIVDKSQTSRPVDVLSDESVPKAIVMSAPKYKPSGTLRNDSSIVKSATRKPFPEVTDPANSAADQTEENPDQTDQAPSVEKKRPGQLLLKFTTDDSCNLKITNLDLDEVINWDLSQNDNGIIYLKPGKYSIVATSVTDGSKTKTYNFEVKPEDEHTTQNLHIKF